MFLIVGLGNPGKDYERTRHNIGFMLADRLASANGIRFSIDGKACRATGDVAGASAVILKPLSYMNLSGTVVARVMRDFNVRSDAVLAVYDDCDLPLGKLRLRKNGGSGGHNGVKSMIDSLQSRDFARLRLGIGRPDYGELKDYVLSPFSSEQRHELDGVLERGVMAVNAFIKDGIDAAMNGFN